MLIRLALKTFLILLLACSPALATNYCNDSNIAGCWLFREGSGTSVDDSSANSNVGNFVASGRPSWTTTTGTNAPSYTGGAVNFVDSTSDKITVTTSSSMDIGTNYSMVVWFYNVGTYGVDAGNDHQHIIGFRNEANRDFYIIKLGGGANTEIRLRTATAVGTITASLSNIQWYHLAFIKTGSSIHAFVNGVDLYNATAAGTCGTTGNFVFGLKPNDGIAGFNDRITESATFQRALSSTEINDIMDNGLSSSAVVGVSPNIFGDMFLQDLTSS